MKRVAISEQPKVEIRCWAERMESGGFQGRALVTSNVDVWPLECQQTHDTPEAAELDAMREVERRLLG
jgi:hypothetical protein